MILNVNILLDESLNLEVIFISNECIFWYA